MATGPGRDAAAVRSVARPMNSLLAPPSAGLSRGVPHEAGTQRQPVAHLRVELAAGAVHLLRTHAVGQSARGVASLAAVPRSGSAHRLKDSAGSAPRTNADSACPTRTSAAASPIASSARCAAKAARSTSAAAAGVSLGRGDASHVRRGQRPARRA